ncbi:hypothetical protein HID58_057831, partial [Brassica napus]
CSCGVLRNLVGVEEIKRYMIEEDDTMTTFIKLIGSKEEIVQKREVFVRQGGIQELVSELSDPNLLSSSKSKETALRAIDKFMFSDRPVFECIDELQVLGSFAVSSKQQEISVQESALKVTSRLCSLPEE